MNSKLHLLTLTKTTEYNNNCWKNVINLMIESAKDECYAYNLERNICLFLIVKLIEMNYSENGHESFQVFFCTYTGCLTGDAALYYAWTVIFWDSVLTHDDNRVLCTKNMFFLWKPCADLERTVKIRLTLCALNVQFSKYSEKCFVFKKIWGSDKYKYFSFRVIHHFLKHPYLFWILCPW